MTEMKYEFRRRLQAVHKPCNRRWTDTPGGGEREITSDWRIVIPQASSSYVAGISKDLQDYLFVSMGISLPIIRVQDVSRFAAAEQLAIILSTKREWPEQGAQLSAAKSYRIHAGSRKMVICGCDERGMGQGCYYVEDMFNLRGAPYYREMDVIRQPLFTPRMVHSGWGLDQFPDEHLNQMAHAGLDAILVFVKDVNQTPTGVLDFNNLVERADTYGLDVYMYSYLESRKHPDEADAEDYYDGTYGNIFAACPRFKGVILVGESVEFPSKDPNTTGMHRLDWPRDKPRTKPSPGWWPCRDYPQWLNMLKKVIRKYNADADIVFWTYNWGYVEEEKRLELIASLPKDITVMATFEMFEQQRHEHVTHVCVDYTISFAGPGKYFCGEAGEAHNQNLRLYTMSNTGGMTWDVGVIPYLPVPYQWHKRQLAVLACRERWGLSGLMESHHYGWWPSFISDLAKWTYWEPSPPAEETLTLLAIRDFSRDAAPDVLEAWKQYSEGIRCYIPTEEDQYGPFRVGPSYPLIFKDVVQIPAYSYAKMKQGMEANKFPDSIVFTDYMPIESPRQSPGMMRMDVESRSLRRMADCWEKGNASLERALHMVSGPQRQEGEFQLALNQFILRTIYTVLNVKKWYTLKLQLYNESRKSRALEILQEMEEVARAEIANATETIPVVEADSRLGWEPSMEYVTSKEQLLWKIDQVQTVLQKEFGDYRKSLDVTAEREQEDKC